MDDWPPDEPREAANFGDSVLFEDRVEAQIATALHPLLLAAATDAAERSVEASGLDPGDVLKEACVAILAAAVAVETGTYWAAYTHDPSLLTAVQDVPELAQKWRLVVGKVAGAEPDLGKGLGQRVSKLADDRNRIAHNPSRGYPLFSSPEERSGGMSAIRTHFTSGRATSAVATASEAIALLGL
jgi:hypothetical protein